MIHVVLPAFNELEALKELIPELLAWCEKNPQPSEVVAVDDGSEDGTGPFLRSFDSNKKFAHLTHPTNQGYGAAIKTGLEYCLTHGQDSDIIITMDADLSHPPSLIAQMLQEMDNGCDVVTASPFVAKKLMVGVPFHRMILTRCANTLFHIFIGWPGVTSYTSGFRLYRSGLIKQVTHKFGTAIQTRGFSASMEVFLKCGLLSARIGEIPLTLRYDLKPGPSKMKIIETIRMYLQLLGRYLIWKHQVQ